MLSTVAANSQGIIAFKAMHTSSFDCSDGVPAMASMFTYGVIAMITACAAAYRVSPAWQQCNKLINQSTAMKSILPSKIWLYDPSSEVQRTDMHTWAW